MSTKVNPPSLTVPAANTGERFYSHSITESEFSDPYREIEETIGHSFKDKSLIERALTHRSALGGLSHGDYERLEYIGDAVFDLAVAHLLSIQHKSASEGELSKMRAALVNATSLAGIARKINLGKHIRLSRSEQANGAHDRASLLADVLEAILGAVYFDAGFETAKSCIALLLGNLTLTVTPRDPKTELQEILHSRGSPPPLYRVERTEGPEHAPVFVSSVEVSGAIVGIGRGTSKKSSQQAAAEEALLQVVRYSESKQRSDTLREPPLAINGAIDEALKENKV